MKTRRHEDCPFLPLGRGHPERPEAETIVVFRNLMIIVRELIALFVIVYLVGVGVVLSPVIQAEWKSSSVSSLAARIDRLSPTHWRGRRDLPWLTAFDGGADFGFGRKEQRDKVSCESSPQVQKMTIDRFNVLSRWFVLGPRPFSREGAL